MVINMFENIFRRKPQIVNPEITHKKKKKKERPFDKLELCIHDGKLGGIPAFNENEVILYSIPLSLQEKVFALYEPGDIISGYMGRPYDTHRFDKRNRKIWVRYFIPKGFSDQSKQNAQCCMSTTHA
jgi:hypothetical protein